jgi:TPR repeat protein
MPINRISFERVMPIATVLVIAALVLASGSAFGQRSSELSADLPDTRTMIVQDKVDKLFDAGDFKRAFFIYRNELAPLGDKYAQYMVGYMYHTGVGIEEDRVTASAWYRLAAERGTPEFIAVRNQSMRKLDDGELRLSNARYKVLRAEYCDLAVLLSSIKRDYRELRERTGTRIQSNSSPMTVIETGRGTIRSGSDYYGKIQRQLGFRLKLLVELGDFQDIETDLEKISIRDIENKVQEKIESDL